MKAIRALFVALLWYSPLVLAADRHVLLDVNADGTLDNCPNPAHNATGTAGNTSSLQVCSGGSSAGKAIGTKTGMVVSAICTSGGGSVANVHSGDLVDLDGDGTTERVYGRPQTCVYNMAKSDSCEIHAGTYRKPGVIIDYNSGSGGTATSCDKGDCVQGVMAAIGYGPNIGTTGYGTAALPGYIRGALTRGVRDSWDPDGDKNPSDGLYPAILSGDVDADGTFDTTACTSAACTGDSFSGTIVGCGGGSYGTAYCGASTGMRIDTNEDGTYDVQATAGVKNVDFLILKDLEYRSFNGGTGYLGSNGARNARTEAIIAIDGNGDTDGLKIDHVYMHDNDYSLGGSFEYSWAYIADSENGGCASYTEIKNSFIVQNNEKVIDDDCGLGNECGCPKNVHDNKVVIDISSARATSRPNVFAYLKSIDTIDSGGRKKVHRIWNNEFIYRRASGTASDKSYFLDLQAFGCSMHMTCTGGGTPGAACTSDAACSPGTCDCNGPGMGELWVYGNLFRNDPAATSSQRLYRFWNTFCGIGTATYRLYFFNNTLDMYTGGSPSLDTVCAAPGELIVERNNAYFNVGAVHASTQVSGSPSRSNEVCTGTTQTECTNVGGVNRTALFQPGAFQVGNPTYFNGAENWQRKSAGPLDMQGTCDPDGDGTVGVDYDWDGTNDTRWQDVGGTLINCSTDTMSVGAARISPCGLVDTVAPTTPNGLTQTQLACGSQEFTWSPSTDVGGSGLAGYNVKIGSTTVGTTDAATTSFGVTGEPKGTQRSFQPQAVDGAGNLSAIGTAVVPTQYLSRSRICSTTSGQTINWNARNCATSGTAVQSHKSLAVDAGGALYEAGTYSSGAGTFGTTTVPVGGNADSYLIKYDSAGAIQWVDAFAGAADDNITDVSTDGTNVVVAGYVSGGTIDLDPGAGTANVAATGGKLLAFVASYDAADGTYQWKANSTAATSADTARAYATVISGSTVFAGGSLLGAPDFGDGAGSPNADSRLHPWLASYELADGTPKWSKRWGHLVSQIPNEGGEFAQMKALTGGGVAVAGHVYGPTNLGCGALPYDGTGAVPGALVAAFDADGTCQWSDAWNDPTQFGAKRILAMDYDGTALFVGGMSRGTILDMQDGSAPMTMGCSTNYDGFVVSVDPSSGAVLWRKSLATATCTADNVQQTVTAVAARGGDVWFAHQERSEPAYDYGGGPHPVLSYGSTVLVRYSAAGAFEFAETLANVTIPKDAVIGPTGDLAVTGSYSGLFVNFGLGALPPNGSGGIGFTVNFTP